ncbi:MAG: ribonuclease III [Gammaproteobacteria bacterium]|nr:ribonuclease III [Gammaproteobacteria bacterium]
MTERVGFENATAELEDAIGYQFKSMRLLVLAMTHRSFSKDNNERLEFLGDAILGAVVSSILFESNPNYQEDQLSLMRAELVKGRSLATLGRSVGIPEMLRLSTGEAKQGGADRESIIADAFEALIGAVYLDAGIEVVEEIVRRLFADRLEKAEFANLKDSKTELQEQVQSEGENLPRYSVVRAIGPDHNKTYEIKCELSWLKLETVAVSGSKKEGEKLAAQKMLGLLQETAV